MLRLVNNIYGKLIAAIAGLLLCAAPMLPVVACCCLRAEDQQVKSDAACCHRLVQADADETTRTESAVKSCCKSRLTKTISERVTSDFPGDPCDCCISGDVPLPQGLLIESVHLKSVMTDWLLYLIPLPANRVNSVVMRANSDAEVFKTHNQNQALLCVWRN